MYMRRDKAVAILKELAAFLGYYDSDEGLVCPFCDAQMTYYKDTGILLHAEECVISRARKLLEEAELPPPLVAVPKKDRTIMECTEPGTWVNVTARVVQLWNPFNQDVAAVGLLGDGTGVIKFIMWESAFPKTLRKGSTYVFENVVVGESYGKLQLKINSRSVVREVV